MYDVIIVGAGPAGLFAAYELSKSKKMKILLLDQGRFAKNRLCPMNKKNIPCTNCQPCNILSGFGGAGTFSDGKLNFAPKIGKSDLMKYMHEEMAENLINETEEIFNHFGMDSKAYPTNLDEALAIKRKVAIIGANLMIIKQKHLGSDKLPIYIQNITDELVSKGVEVKENTTVLDIISLDKDKHKVIIKGEELLAKYVIVAPGRTGAKGSRVSVTITSHTLQKVLKLVYE